MKKNWSRQDVVNWMRMINECGCEDQEASIYDETTGLAPEAAGLLNLNFDSIQGEGAALCPDTYRAVASKVCDDPHAVLQAIKPIMAEIGVGCPQSFARALADVFQVGQEVGIIGTFNTNMPK